MQGQINYLKISGKVKCKMCGRVCTRTSSRQMHCKECSPKYYKIMQKKRSKIYEKKRKFNNKHYSPPIWKCPNCKKETQLIFKPIDKNMMWLHFQCPECKYKIVK